MCRAASLVLAAAFLAHPVLAADIARPLLLEIWINGRNTHVVARATAEAGGFALSRADAERAGLEMADANEAENIVHVGAAVGIPAKLDEANQRLLLDVPAARMKTQVFDLRPSEDVAAAQSGSGAILDYDVSGTLNAASGIAQRASGGASLSLSVFTPDALFTATGFANAGMPGQGGARLDSTVEFDDAAHVRKFLVGDAVTGSLDWSRAVRFGGVQWASDFSLQPDLVTLPLPQFFGQAAVPSTVDVFSGAARLFETEVAPGPFALNNLPAVTGSGTATVVMRDVLGRETTQTISFYTSNRLLAEGLTSYDLDAGFLRRGYGERSFSYAAPVASFTVRHGLDNSLTLEAHGEASPDVALIGGGAAFGIGNFAALSADLAASRSVRANGALASLGMDAQAAPFTFFGSLALAEGRYADLASLEAEPVPRRRFQLGSAISLGRGGALAASWIGETGEDADINLVSASYSLSLGSGLFFGFTGLRDVARHDWAAQAFFSVPLGNGFASANVSANNNRPTAQGAYDVPVNPDGGFGWRAMGQTGDFNQLEADATYIGTHATLDGGVASDNGALAARADASGALVLLDGGLFATRQPDGALALVRAGQPDVRIYRENREVAVSDSDGEALLTGLTPNAENRIAIEPRDYSMAVAVNQTGRTIVPRRNSGVIVDLAPRQTHSFVMRLVLANGAAPPVGARVDIETMPAQLMVGRDGEVFVSGLEIAAHGVVTWDKGRCGFAVKPPPPSATIVRTGSVLCGDDHAP